MDVQAPDPILTSPMVDCPTEQFIEVTLRMRSTGDPSGQLYFGKEFTEENSRNFTVKNDGQWHDYRISFPAPGPGVRFRLDPSSNSGGTVSVTWVRVEAIAELPNDPWARPSELRNKKFIGGGLYATHGDETAITPRYLATHPSFAESYPFDGVVLPGILSSEWVASLNLTKKLPTGEIPWRPTHLHSFLWNTVRIPDEAVAQTISDLKSMRRGSLTDNFLIYGLLDGARGRHLPDLTNDNDWAIVEGNARLAARICREGKLKGFWLDTEQYTQYRTRAVSGTAEFDADKPQDQPFPLGKDTPDVLRRRGAQWIKAVQSEFPEIKIMTTFAWSEDSISYGPLKGVIPFLDGVLEGITTPGQIIHGHENTFYFGHAAGTTHAPTGIPGHRYRYEWARSAIRHWRMLSNNPAKYDSFVKVGMAAWMEDHPWGVSTGTQIGTKQTLWSNLPLAIAYSDEYVWVWSEATHYGQNSTALLNPFLASLNNETFNTNKEAVATFEENFAVDPMRRGWYFDFDMLAIGRKESPEQAAPTMSTLALPYAWNQEAHALFVHGESPSRLNGQRRRFVRPITEDAARLGFHVSIDFRVDSFGSNDTNPIVLGLFNKDLPLNEQSAALQISSPNKVAVVIVANGESLNLPIKLPSEMKSGETYHLELNYVLATRNIEATLTSQGQVPDPQAKVMRVLPTTMGQFAFDEVGIALYEAPPRPTTASEAYRYFVEKVTLHP